MSLVAIVAGVLLLAILGYAATRPGARSSCWNPQSKFTNVTWAILGPVPYVMKVMCIFFSMDKMLGKDFEAGLTNMKAIAEN